MFYKAGAPILSRLTESVIDPIDSETHDMKVHSFIGDDSEGLHLQDWTLSVNAAASNTIGEFRDSIFPSITAVIRKWVDVVFSADNLKLWPPGDVGNGFEWVECSELDMLPKGRESSVVLARYRYPMAPICIAALGKQYMHAVALLSNLEAFSDTSFSWPDTDSSNSISSVNSSVVIINSLDN